MRRKSIPRVKQTQCKKRHGDGVTAEVDRTGKFHGNQVNLVCRCVHAVNRVAIAEVVIQHTIRR